MAILTKLIGICKSVLVDPKKPLQELQVEITEGEVKTAVKHYEPFGITGNPPVNSEGLIAFLGDRSNAVVLCITGNQCRPTDTSAGDVTIYNQGGALIKLIGGNLEITGNVTINGNVLVNGGIVTTADTVADGISLINHVHKDVKAGSDDSGKPKK